MVGLITDEIRAALGDRPDASWRAKQVSHWIYKKAADNYDAMREVPREAFVPEGLQEFAYEDAPLPIAEGQTISQPYVVGLMLQAAEIGPKDRVLEIGAGSGYAAAVMSRMAAQVYAIERHQALTRAAAGRLIRLG